MPPYLAGRKKEQEEFVRLLDQDIVMDNMVLTGLRGVGKTVLLDTLKPMAMAEGWSWVGADLSEAASLSEENISTRMLADLSVVTSPIRIEREAHGMGFKKSKGSVPFDFRAMSEQFAAQPGLASDKLKTVLERAWDILRPLRVSGVIFAYDEAQNLQNHAAKDEHPLSLMLDVFQSLQKKQVPFMLLLTGLPTLFPKLVEARTFSERMFRVVVIDRLTEDESRNAVIKPVEHLPTQMDEKSVDVVIKESSGYPYFIQFMCREVYDVFLRNIGKKPTVSITDIKRKLDADFFAGRWARASDRQRELLQVVSLLPDCDSEFTIQEVATTSGKVLAKPFSNSHISQMFTKLSDLGLVYKNRHGKYAFAVPMLGDFIRRQKS